MRTWDAYKVAPALDLFSNNRLDPIQWLSDPSNIVLENDTGDLAVFEYGLKDRKVYSGHYFFKSRGRKAIDAARMFLDEIFNSCYNINVVIGLVPVENKAARWLSRQVGFKAHGFDELNGHQFELFIMTKKEF